MMLLVMMMMMVRQCYLYVFGMVMKFQLVLYIAKELANKEETMGNWTWWLVHSNHLARQVFSLKFLRHPKRQLFLHQGLNSLCLHPLNRVQCFRLHRYTHQFLRKAQPQFSPPWRRVQGHNTPFLRQVRHHQPWSLRQEHQRQQFHRAGY